MSTSEHDDVQVELENRRGIWEELKSNCFAQLGSCVQLLSRSAFNFIAVVVAQFRLPISEHVVKIHRRFAVRS